MQQAGETAPCHWGAQVGRGGGAASLLDCLSWLAALLMLLPRESALSEHAHVGGCINVCLGVFLLEVITFVCVCGPS